MLLLVETVRNVAAAKNALLVPKGISFFPDSNVKVSGNIDIWWIVRILLFHTAAV